MQRPLHTSKRYVIGERSVLMVVAVCLAGGRVPVIPFLALCRTEKRDLLRQDLHHLMLGSCSTLIFAGLNAPLNGDEPLG